MNQGVYYVTMTRMLPANTLELKQHLRPRNRRRAHETLKNKPYETQRSCPDRNLVNIVFTSRPTHAGRHKLLPGYHPVVIRLFLTRQ